MEQTPTEHPRQSLSEVHSSVDIRATRPGWRRVFAFIGPAYLVSVGYMDPGNWATDIAGGAKFGYQLIWVLLLSNVSALLLQSLAARMGIVSGMDLAQANRTLYPRPVNYVLYVLAELAIAATDLAEVLGMAVGIQLLTGLPLLYGVTITVLDTFLLLYLQKKGIRVMEAFIVGLVFIIGMSFLVELFLAKPDMGQVVKGFLPGIPNKEALYIAIGIIGATVMPHNLYLHSSLVQTRKIERSEAGIRQAIKWNFVDAAIALNLAFFVNAGILILAATVFHFNGMQEIASIKEAHHFLDRLLGTQLAPTLFAVALIAAGQSSTITGTLAGQIVMEGYLHLRINPWARRLLTRLIAVIPAVLVIYWLGESEVDRMLVFSQVILSLQLGFAIIPLIHVSSDAQYMGIYKAPWWVQVLAWLITSVLVALNISMVFGELWSLMNTAESKTWPLVLLLTTVGLLLLLGFILIQPLLLRRAKAITPDSLHGRVAPFGAFPVTTYQRIALALEFSKHDEQLIQHALSQGGKDTEYILIHVVESVAARYAGSSSADQETKNDQARLDFYIQQLRERGYRVSGYLGYNQRTKEIVRLVKSTEAEMLVIGAHGHRGFTDWLFGETINSVRHHLSVPILVVNVGK